MKCHSLFLCSYKDEKEILETNDRIQIIRDKDYLGFYELVIADVQKTDAGTYSCKATNKHGEANCDAIATTVGKSSPDSPINIW